MRSIKLQCCVLLATASCFAQCRPTGAAVVSAPVKISGADSISSKDRAEIERSLQSSLFGKPYEPLDVKELLREAIQDLGYYKAEVSEPQIHFAPGTDCNVDFIAVQVEEGLQYRIKEPGF